MAQPSIFDIISLTDEEYKKVAPGNDKSLGKEIFFGRMTTPDIFEIADAVIKEKDKITIKNCTVWHDKTMQTFNVAGEAKCFVIQGMYEIQKLVKKCSLIYQAKIDAYTLAWIDHEYDD